MRIEKLKSLLLASLFIVSLLLTQRLWFYLPFGEVISTANDIDTENIDIDVTDLLSPQNFTISFGGGTYTVFFSEPYEVWNIASTLPKDSENTYNKKDIWIWETAKNVLKEHLGEGYEVQEIGYDQWIKIMKFKSLIMNFACEIPGDILIDALIGQKSDSKISERIDTILILAAEEEKNDIYFGNNEKNVYFKLKSGVLDNRIRILIENIEKVGQEKGYIEYVTLQSRYNTPSKVKSDVLIPIFAEGSEPIPSYSAKNQIDVSDKLAVKNQAYQFFGRTFDFVKEINEIDGTVIYMYGYGEKSLKLNKNGTLEYVEKVNKHKTGSHLDFIDSLKLAAKFVEEKGKWPVNIKNTYLSDYELVEKNNKKGYRFSFNYRLKGFPIFIPDIGEDKGIEVEIIGNQITYYKRIVKSPPQKLNDEEKGIFSIFNNEEDKDILNVLEVLIKNKEDIKDNYINLSQKDKDQGITIEELIKDIGIVYFSYKDKLIPVWEITIDNIVYYFDLYTGTRYTFTKKN
ncbi:hypothetical protein [Paramaledivibacter caminithermalis]|uniref:Two-component signal transduction system YycFG, regulatory protein YycH n=1 Tax=Paramaledivibacter caminithermalis (strain DSM 15212 / CIP 107654 / DViRD3) TaxID=1121301 RepID=A0A1M6NBW1_PARC5|nr:hypothetical protein [Paramaledivibacter caminithermalis]SHJ93181.1 hypothetical protein SAMN02745912_01660 [Paramaledivibacter caminithermalis DSM 15212]